MRLNNPWLSPPGFVFTAIILLFVVIAIRRGGHLLFSPGSLSAIGSDNPLQEGFSSHAAFEKECQVCHQPLKVRQVELCIECHQGVAEQRERLAGTHGEIPPESDCAGCHPDHRGRDFDMLVPALARFDHSRTNFSLIHHQINYDATPMNCMRCHVDRDFSGTNFPCTECHALDLRFDLGEHSRAFGENCLACHDGLDRMLPFNHQETRFPLEGQHEAIACAACHDGSEFLSTPLSCDGCHGEPAVHAGLFGEDCSSCHGPAGWTPAYLDEQPFTHDENTRFSLNHHNQDFSGDILTCESCHEGGYPGFVSSTCVACHAKDEGPFIEGHQAEFGAGCLDCHDGTDRMKNFDHANFFILDGRHAEAECTGCHVDQNWNGLSKLCADCHAEPEIHADLFGLQCEYCHETGAWTPAQLKVHVFPLDHGEPPAPECTVCHLEKYSEYTCYGCHEHQEQEILESHLEDGISPGDIPQCKDCHPTGIIGEGR